MKKPIDIPGPLTALFHDGSSWPVWDLDARSGIFQADVNGKLVPSHRVDVRAFRDAAGVEHDSKMFFKALLKQVK